MKIKYSEFIDQTLYFPQEEFTYESESLHFHGINLMNVIEKFGTPLKITYLPKISQNIQRAKKWFAEAIDKNGYRNGYRYCYCTKSSHFSFVLEEALKNDISIETSSAYDVDIVKRLFEKEKVGKDIEVICNGFKTDDYLEKISNLINDGFENIMPIIDNYRELDKLTESIDKTFNIGIRIASEEDPRSEFYTSRLGIGYKNILPFYNREIKDNPKVRLKMLHFFINTGIKDNAYYWNELLKCLRVYIQLKKVAPELDSLNIGGGFPIKSSLAFEYDYAYMVDEIIRQIKITCDQEKVPVPNIFTEFGSFTVGEAGGAIYEIMYQKQQNDREKWDMINSSFITTLPDSWAINKRFVLLPINRWNDEYERVLLGGLTCDGDDYYNSEQNMNAIYLPKYNKNKPLYIGFFNTGAYQDSIGGVGGLQHCLIPQPKIVLIDKDKDGKITSRLFMEQQKAEDMLKILGY